MPKNARNIGLIILPIHVVMPLGRRVKNMTKAKNINVNTSCHIHPLFSPTKGAMPVVYESDPHLGIANSGPMVRYSAAVNNLPYFAPTLLDSCSKLSLLVLPIAATAKIGMVTAVMQKPKIAGQALLPAICPRWTGNIRLPAPKNMPNSVLATTMVSFMLSLLFFIIILFFLL